MARTTATSQPPSPPRPEGKARAAQRKKPLTFAHWLVLAALFTVPLAIVAYKCTSAPGSNALADALSLDHLPADMKARVRHVLFTPLGALVVILFRLTLGLRVLGPFRSVLLAVAFQITGTLVGIGFFALVVGVVTLLRPRLKGFKMPYFGRACAMLVAVTCTILATMLVGEWIGASAIVHAAYFPVVVLTLAGDAFASTVRREGRRSAVWRAGVTALAAALIALVSQSVPLQHLFLRFPELTLCVLGLIVVVSRFMAFRWLQAINPPPVKRRKKKTGGVALAAPSARGGDSAPATCGLQGE